MALTSYGLDMNPHKVIHMQPLILFAMVPLAKLSISKVHEHVGMVSTIQLFCTEIYND